MSTQQNYDGGIATPNSCWAKVTGGTVSTYTNAGGIVMEVHVFTAASGTLYVSKGGFAELLIVGGGGSGGYSYGHGGGAGGFLEKHKFLSQPSYAVVVGAGGVTPSPTANPGNSGGYSSLGSDWDLIALGGGAGGYQFTATGIAGGSGGGAAAGGAGLQYPGGYSGGSLPYSTSAGGGGANGPGTHNGGPGRQSSITGTAVYYAAGGGGTLGGANGAGWRGVANSGDGSKGDDGLNGMSGIIIVAVAI
jgi:hypothetical protein